MSEKPEAYCGVVTVEKPFVVSRRGIDFRGSEALKINQEIGSKNCVEICEVLNFAYQRGFSEGQREMSKIYKNMFK